MRWVADTGPLLHFAEAQALDLLKLLGDVVLPPAVADEFARLHSNLTLPSWLKIVPLVEADHRQAEDWHLSGLIDRGEAHAIALVRHLRADVLLTDYATARLFANSMGVQARGSLGVVLWLAGQRLIDAPTASTSLDRLAGTTLWLSPRILAEARAALHRLAE